VVSVDGVTKFGDLYRLYIYWSYEIGRKEAQGLSTRDSALVEINSAGKY
jgi:hypothetical protein